MASQAFSSPHFIQLRFFPLTDAGIKLPVNFICFRFDDFILKSI